MTQDDEPQDDEPQSEGTNPDSGPAGIISGSDTPHGNSNTRNYSQQETDSIETPASDDLPQEPVPEPENDLQSGSDAPEPNLKSPIPAADTWENSEIKDDVSSTTEAEQVELTPDHNEQLNSFDPSFTTDIKVPLDLEQPVALILRNVEDRIRGLAEIITDGVNHRLTESLSSIQTHFDENLSDQQQTTSHILETLESAAVKKDQKIRELEEQNQKLSRDVTDYRQGSKGNEVESFIKTLFPLYDNLVGVTQKFTYSAAFKEDTSIIIRQLLGIFEAAGVSIYQSEGDDYKSPDHMPIGDHIYTHHKEQDRKIVASVKNGFKGVDGKILQPELVTLYIFRDSEGKAS